MGDSNSSVHLADLNGDGHLDIVTTGIPLVDPTFGDVAGNTVSVAFGDGRGNFSSGRNYVGTGLSYSLAIADFNGDGKPDVVSVSPTTDTATVSLFLLTRYLAGHSRRWRRKKGRAARGGLPDPIASQWNRPRVVRDCGEVGLA